MAPILALLLCTSFIVVLLRVDRKQTGTVAPGLWLPTIWMLLVATKPLNIWFGMREAGDDAEGSTLDRLVLSGILCLGLLLLAKRRFDWQRVTKRNAWLLLLLGYSLISVLWSDIPFISFKRWARELLAVVMAFVVVTEPDPRQAAQTVLRRTAYILIPFSLLLIKYFPQYGVEYGAWNGELMWVGATVQKNGLGRICLISIFFLMWTLIKRWRRHEKPATSYQTGVDLLVIVMGFWLLIGGGIATYSATAVAALGAGLIMLASFVPVGKRNRQFVAAIWIGIILLSLAFGIALPFLESAGSVAGTLTEAFGRNQTFTGRTEIWTRLLAFFELRPVFGYGFGGFWTGSTEAAARFVKEAHNGYLGLCLELGLVGLLLTSMFLWSVIRKAQSALTHDPDWAILCLCFVLIVVIHNFSESSINSFQRHLMATLLFLAVATSVESAARTGRRRLAIRPPSAVAASSQTVRAG